MSSPPSASAHVMIVEDSSAVRGLLHRYFENIRDILITAYATSGDMALKLLPEQECDLIVVDVDNDDIDDDLSILPAILALNKDIKIICISEQVADNASLGTLALQKGASDILAKPPRFSDRSIVSAFHTGLESRIRALLGRENSSADHKPYPAQATPSPPPPTSSRAEQPAPKASPVRAPSDIDALLPDRGKPGPDLASKRPSQERYPTLIPKAWAIGSSTGGPEALASLFKSIAGHIPAVPIFITQHLPPKFTSNLAKHIEHASGRSCVPGEDGMIVNADTIYLAPGDFHMVLTQKNGQLSITLNQEPPENFCRPAVDVMLRSLSDHYGQNLLVSILTGMGQDGMLGCQQVKQKGGTVIAQDRDSCVVWGMPRAVEEAGLCSAIMSLAQMPQYLKKAFGG